MLTINIMFVQTLNQLKEGGYIQKFTFRKKKKIKGIKETTFQLHL